MQNVKGVDSIVRAQVLRRSPGGCEDLELSANNNQIIKEIGIFVVAWARVGHLIMSVPFELHFFMAQQIPMVVGHLNTLVLPIQILNMIKVLLLILFFLNLHNIRKTLISK